MARAGNHEYRPPAANGLFLLARRDVARLTPTAPCPASFIPRRGRGSVEAFVQAPSRSGTIEEVELATAEWVSATIAGALRDVTVLRAPRRNLSSGAPRQDRPADVRNDPRDHARALAPGGRPAESPEPGITFGCRGVAGLAGQAGRTRRSRAIAAALVIPA